MALETRSPATVSFGVFEADLRAGELRKQGKRIKLQDQPFQVLAVLLQRPGDVVTREELRSHIWPEDTFVDFDNGLNTVVNKLREALGDSADNPRFVETLPRRGYRFLARVTGDGLEKPARRAFNHKAVPLLGIAVVLLVAAAAGGWFWHSRHSRVLTEKDSIVLADFTNTTGEPVFDDTLKQGLRAQLEQSPFLNLLSDQQVSEELRLMARQPGEHLTADLARDLCRRIGSKAVLNGSISSLGSHYVIRLTATNCQTGSLLGAEQSESADKEHVLASLGVSATKIREKLGESLASVQKYDVPIERVTTTSLDALRAYSLGMRYLASDDVRAALPHFQRAAELDPNFASAYVEMAHAASYIEEQGSIVKENLEKAYALRDRVSRREYFYIVQKHFAYADDSENSMAQLQLWAETYPRDAEVHFLLADTEMWKGNWKEAVKQARLSVDLNPKDVRYYFNLAVSELALERLDAAARTCDQAIARNKNDVPSHQVRYWIAFVRHDPKEMENEVKALGDLAGENPDAELDLLQVEGATAMYYGKLARARDLSQRTADHFVRFQNEDGVIAW